MSGTEPLLYSAIRILSCGIWTAAGLYKAPHYEQTIAEMTHLHVPWPRLILSPVLILELFGSVFVFLDFYT